MIGINKETNISRKIVNQANHTIFVSITIVAKISVKVLMLTVVYEKHDSRILIIDFEAKLLNIYIALCNLTKHDIYFEFDDNALLFLCNIYFFLSCS